jgi:hypothetical protein
MTTRSRTTAPISMVSTPTSVTSQRHIFTWLINNLVILLPQIIKLSAVLMLLGKIFSHSSVHRLIVGDRGTTTTTSHPHLTATDPYSHLAITLSNSRFAVMWVILSIIVDASISSSLMHIYLVVGHSAHPSRTTIISTRRMIPEILLLVWCSSTLVLQFLIVVVAWS